MSMDPHSLASFERFTDQWFRVDSPEGSLFSTALSAPRQRMLIVSS